MADNWTGNTLNVSAGALSSTSMRYHELALQRWLNQVFYVRWGVPVPVVYTSPMDAFAEFSRLWSEANNPFQYLLEAKDAKGTPLYQPYPAPVRYPVISVYRKGWKFRNYQNFSQHRMRHINWPTVSSTGSALYGVPNVGTNLTECNLGEVTTSRFPMAFDYRFQIDHFCNRPDTQAFFTSQLFRQFWRTGGPTLQTWLKVSYPGFGDKLVRMYLEGDIANMTPEEPEAGKNVEFRTSFTLVIEGYDIDLDYTVYPALWNLIFSSGAVNPQSISSFFAAASGTVSLREQPDNPVVDYRREVSVMPATGTCPTVLRDIRLEADQINEIVFNSLVVTYPGPLTYPGYPPAAGVTVFGGGTLTGLPLYVEGGTYSDSGSMSVGFYYGSYALVADPFIDGGTYTDSGSTITGFHVGSMDLYIYIESAPVTSGFYSGSLFEVTLAGGTLYENGSQSIAFQIGTHADTIIRLDAGTSYGTQSWAFFGGTYADVVVDGGTYAESGSSGAGFFDGTYSAFIIAAGTYYEAGSQSIGFYSGTHQSA